MRLFYYFRSLTSKLFLACSLMMLGISSAYAVKEEHGVKAWQLGFQKPASPVMEHVEHFHNFLLYIIIGISVFVLVLLAYACWRFREKKNPVPSKRSHNVVIEVIWTIVPVIILLVIAVPSFKLLFFAERIPKAEMTLKVIGYQWYWGYQYPEYKLAFESNMKKAEDLKPGEPRLLEVDNAVVLPINTNIRLQTTAADVIHSWAVPAFGVKLDAIPGRLNESWFNIDRPGIYYGQCSELCGVMHGFMPIKIIAVSKEDFLKWTQSAKEKFSSVQNQNILLNKAPVELALK